VLVNAARQRRVGFDRTARRSLAIPSILAIIGRVRALLGLDTIAAIPVA
jgi:hypothetical protein